MRKISIKILMVLMAIQMFISSATVRAEEKLISEQSESSGEQVPSDSGESTDNVQSLMTENNEPNVIDNEIISPVLGYSGVGFQIKTVHLIYKCRGETVKSVSFVWRDADRNLDYMITDDELSSEFEYGIPEGYWFGGYGTRLVPDDFPEIDNQETEPFELEIYDTEPDDEQLMNSQYRIQIYKNNLIQQSDPFIWKELDLNSDGILSFDELSQGDLKWSDSYDLIDFSDLGGLKFKNPDNLADIRSGRVLKCKLVPDEKSEKYNELINSVFTITRYAKMEGSLESLEVVWREANDDDDLTILTIGELSKYIPEGYSPSYQHEDVELSKFYSSDSREISLSFIPEYRQEEFMDCEYSLDIYTGFGNDDLLKTVKFIWKDRDLDKDCYLQRNELAEYLPEGYDFRYYKTSWTGVDYLVDLYDDFEQSIYLIEDPLNVSVSISFIENDDPVKSETIIWKEFDINQDRVITDSELEPLLPENYLFENSGNLLLFDDGKEQTVHIKKKDSPTVEPVDQFVDIPEGHWARGVINEAVEKGIMVGLDDEHFGPSEPMSRAMAVTVLWRLAGTPETAYKNSFTDIQDDLWYTKAVNWAVENNVVHGMTDTTFEPDTNINREQLAVMITNYLHSRGMSLETDQSLDQFKDKDEVSSFAETSMKFVVKHGIMSGAENGTMLMPKKDTERAEGAKMFLLASKLN